MPDKADLPEVLRVLDVLLHRLSDGERLPLSLVKLVRQCVAGKGDAVSSPAEDADGRAEICRRGLRFEVRRNNNSCSTYTEL